MPTYEYQCKTCGHRFEYFQSITSDPLTHCPVEECIQEDPDKKGTGEVVRLISAGAGLVFKGEGFYLTDYARKKSSPSGKSGSSGSSGSSETKSEGTKGGGEKGGTGGSATSGGGSSDS
jgi:putative FmdB family regulatory protein